MLLCQGLPAYHRCMLFLPLSLCSNSHHHYHHPCSHHALSHPIITSICPLISPSLASYHSITTTPVTTTNILYVSVCLCLSSVSLSPSLRVSLSLSSQTNIRSLVIHRASSAYFGIPQLSLSFPSLAPPYPPPLCLLSLLSLLAPSQQSRHVPPP